MRNLWSIRAFSWECIIIIPSKGIELKIRTSFQSFWSLHMALFGLFKAISEILRVLAPCRHLKIQNRTKIAQATSQNVKVYQMPFGQLLLYKIVQFKNLHIFSLALMGEFRWVCIEFRYHLKANDLNFYIWSKKIWKLMFLLIFYWVIIIFKINFEDFISF